MIDNNELKRGYPLLSEKPIKINSIQSVKRLLSRLITEFQQGETKDSYCRTLCYMLNTWVSIHNNTEIEERISILEQQVRKETKL